MKESDARRVLLMRAFEAPLSAPWTDADAQWSGREAAQLEGARTSPERLISRRAALGVAWLIKREPAVDIALRATRWPVWAGPLIVLAGALAGLALDAIGSGRSIQILAPPLFGMLLWNLVVYLGLIAAALRSRRAGPATPEAPAKASGLIRRGLVRAQQGVARVSHPALRRFLGDWALRGRALHAQRATAILHAAAAALIVGAIVSMYARGLSFAYQAGWDSTFLSPDGVHRILKVVLGPASFISRIPLPDADQLAALRFANGGGENAARFIHLWSLTLVIVVVLPRLVLAAFAGVRATQLAARFPLSLDDPYFQRLLRSMRGEKLAIGVLPYQHAQPADTQQRLAAWCAQAAGQSVALTLQAGPEPGDEGNASALEPLLGAAGAVLVLFAATATPERETHGLLLDTLATLRPGRLAVVVDEAAFRARFTGAGAAQRIDERREAWRALLRDVGHVPIFIDLSANASVAPNDELTTALTAIGHR